MHMGIFKEPLINFTLKKKKKKKLLQRARAATAARVSGFKLLNVRSTGPPFFRW